jgi:branched-subunit amino acid transport protein
VSAVWVIVIAVGAGTMAMKALGPVLLGGRPLPRRLAGPLRLLAPSLLAALVVTNVFASGRDLVLDARALGLAAAVLALALRAPLLVAVAVAAAVTALARAVA